MNSSRITLRPFTQTDVDDLLLWTGDDQVTRFIRWNTLTSKNEAPTFIKEVCIPHPWRRSICIDDRSVGFISIFPWSGDDRCKADIGFGLAVKCRGQGITTLALKIALSQVLDDLPNILRLQAFADVENKASQRVLEKAGFHKVYLENIKDLFVYSFLSTDVILKDP